MNELYCALLNIDGIVYSTAISDANGLLILVQWNTHIECRVEAESLLLKEAKGKSVQLVRPSSVPNSYALSQYNAQTHSFIHMLITPVPGKFTAPIFHEISMKTPSDFSQ
jgi:hypothetical protein